VPDGEWAAIESACWGAATPTVVLAMEPSVSDVGRVELTVRADARDEPQRLAWCGHHGPPVVWQQ
jgi:hypothetical protein